MAAMAGLPSVKEAVGSEDSFFAQVIPRDTINARHVTHLEADENAPLGAMVKACFSFGKEKRP